MNPGWYRSETNPEVAEYWDGTQWTGQTRELPESLRKPMPRPPQPEVNLTPEEEAAAQARKERIFEKAAREGTMFGTPRGNVYSAKTIFRFIIPLAAFAFVFFRGFLPDISSTYSDPYDTYNPIYDPPASEQVDTYYDENITSDSVRLTARTLESMKGQNKTLPGKLEIEKYGNPVTGTASVAVAYYDADKNPTDDPATAEYYMICGYNSDNPNLTAYYYSTLSEQYAYNKGIDYADDPTVTDPCRRPALLESGNAAPETWNPDDINYTLTYAPPGQSETGTIQNTIWETAQAINLAYADTTRYPAANQLQERGHTIPDGHQIYIAYYDEYRDPITLAETGGIEDSYLICGYDEKERTTYYYTSTGLEILEKTVAYPQDGRKGEPCETEEELLNIRGNILSWNPKHATVTIPYKPSADATGRIWQGKDSWGGVIIVEETPDNLFVDGKPKAVNRINKVHEGGGCKPLEKEFNYWYKQKYSNENPDLTLRERNNIQAYFSHIGTMRNNSACF